MAFDAQGFQKVSDGPAPAGPEVGTLKGLKIAKILRVADAVEKSAMFTMEQYVHDCGTAACIAGHSVSSRTRARASNGPATNLEKEARIALGLDDVRAWELFHPNHSYADWWVSEGMTGWISPPHAAACLRKLAATGEVDWLGTKPSKAEA